MAKTTREITKSRKSRAPAAGEPILVRIQPALAKRLDTWRAQQSDLPSRPEAMRRLAEAGLTVKTKT